MEFFQLDETKTHLQGFANWISSFSMILSETAITTNLHEELFLEQGFQTIINLLMQCRFANATVYIVGNGGSAAIASHAVIDFVNMAKMRAHALLDPAVTTCISNDYGYEQIYSKQLAQFIQTDDVLIAISSSGQSKNIMNAVAVAKMHNAKVITLSGFSQDNPLRKMGQYNLWLDSEAYGAVEIGHAFILHYLTDYLRETL